jgi:hypothetical protein
MATRRAKTCSEMGRGVIESMAAFVAKEGEREKVSRLREAEKRKNQVEPGCSSLTRSNSPCSQRSDAR